MWYTARRVHIGLLPVRVSLVCAAASRMPRRQCGWLPLLCLALRCEGGAWAVLSALHFAMQTPAVLTSLLCSCALTQAGAGCGVPVREVMAAVQRDQLLRYVQRFLSERLTHHLPSVVFCSALRALAALHDPMTSQTVAFSSMPALHRDLTQHTRVYTYHSSHTPHTHAHTHAGPARSPCLRRGSQGG